MRMTDITPSTAPTRGSLARGLANAAALGALGGAVFGGVLLALILAQFGGMGWVVGVLLGLMLGGACGLLVGAIVGPLVKLVLGPLSPSSRKRTARKLTFVLMGLTALAWVAVAIASRRGDRSFLGNTLRVTLPRSITAVTCTGWGWTDVLARCAFELEAQDFPALLGGHAFVEYPCMGRTNHDAAGGGPDVGPTYPASACYRAEPPDFKHGGHVLIVANATRTRAILDLYVE